MGTYYQRNDARAYFNLATNETALEETTATPATLTGSVPSLQQLTSFGFSTPSGGVGQLDWSGNYSAQIEVTSIGASLTFDPVLRRQHSTGQAAQVLATGRSGTGLHPVSATGSGNFVTQNVAATDRLGLEVAVNNSNMMSAESITIRVNTTDSYVGVPWTVGTPPTVTPLQKKLLNTTTLNAVHRSTW